MKNASVVGAADGSATTPDELSVDAWMREMDDVQTRTAALQRAPLLIDRLRRTGRHPEAVEVVTGALRQARGADLLARLGGRQALLSADLGEAGTASSAETLDQAGIRAAAQTLAEAADRALTFGREAVAADHLMLALNVLLHRSLHTLDTLSPLSRKHSGWLDPVTRSATYSRLHLRTRRAPAAGSGGPRVLLLTDGNANFLGEVEHALLEADARVTHLDLAGLRADGGIPTTAALARARLGDPIARAAVDASAAVPQVAALLGEADTVVVDWCTAAAVWASLVAPPGARLIIRLHSVEAFSVEPHLVDWSRVDDLVVVGGQLEGLVRDVVPALAPARTRRGGPRVHVIPNPVALAGSSPGEQAALAKRPDAARTVALVGWGRPVKDPLWALEVVDELRRHDPRWRLLLVGADYTEPHSPLARRYRAQVLRRLDAAGDAVQRAGWTDNLPELLRDAEYVLSSSRRESHGVAFCEAVAAGCLPVTRDWPDVAEFGGAGEIFPADWVVRSPQEAAARVLALAAQPADVRARSAAEAAGIVRARYDKAAVVPRMLDVLLPTTGTEPDGARPGDGPRPHLVYLAIGFPPAATSGAHRMRAIANLFVDRGWDVTVVTIDRQAWDLECGLDLSLLDLVDPRVRIVELPLRRTDLDPEVSTYSWFRARHPARWVRIRHRLDTLPFPEQVFGPWRRTLERGTEAVVRDRPADLLLVSPAPYTTLAVAPHLRRRTRTPYAIDLRDGWSVGVDGEAFGTTTRRGRWERRVLAEAEAISTVNEPVATFYRERYPDLAPRIQLARNGFDDLGTSLTVARRPDPAAGLAFGHLGTTALAPAHLALVVDAWTAARARDEVLARSTLTFHGYAGAAGASPDAEVLTQADAPGVTYGGPVAPADVAATYSRWDALLLAPGGGRFSTSAQVYEHLATGLPVLSAHEVPHAAQDVLEGYPLWIRPPALTVEALRDGFVETARRALSASEDDRAAARDHASRFERSLQLEPFVTLLDERFGHRDPAPHAAGPLPTPVEVSR